MVKKTKVKKDESVQSLPPKGVTREIKLQKGAMYFVRQDGMLEQVSNVNKEEIEKLKNQNQKMILRQSVVEPKKGLLGWIEKKVNRSGGNDSPISRRYHRIHEIVKNKLFKRGIWVMKKAMGRYMIKGLEDIPEEPWNDNLRMIYYSFDKGLQDTFAGIPFNHFQFARRHEAKPFENRKQYQEWLKSSKFWSYDNRMSMINLLFTEILEDSFDRELWNMFSFRLYWNMHDHYKGDVPRPGEFPIYTGVHPDNPEYFKKFEGKKTWDGYKDDPIDKYLDQVDMIHKMQAIGIEKRQVKEFMKTVKHDPKLKDVWERVKQQSETGQ